MNRNFATEPTKDISTIKFQITIGGVLSEANCAQNLSQAILEDLINTETHPVQAEQEFVQAISKSLDGSNINFSFDLINTGQVPDVFVRTAEVCAQQDLICVITMYTDVNAIAFVHAHETSLTLEKSNPSDKGSDWQISVDEIMFLASGNKINLLTDFISLLEDAEKNDFTEMTILASARDYLFETYPSLLEISVRSEIESDQALKI